MSDRPVVLVLAGGPDAEREVSLDSGREVAAALRAGGRYRVGEETIDAPSADTLRGLAGDVVFPVLHGPWGEGGPLQERLEMLGRPYVGSGPRASALAMDKAATKRVVASHGVATPRSQVIGPGEPCRVPPPLVLKPVDDGSSVDMRICRGPEAVAEGRSALEPSRGRLLAEAYIAGRELTVGILGGEPLPVVEIVPAVEFYDYEAKYRRHDTRYVIDPDLPPGTADRCRRDAVTAYERLGCRDLARVDFMLDEDGPWFLELNTMPGFTSHSLLPKAAVAHGLDFTALCERLVELALARARQLTADG